MKRTTVFLPEELERDIQGYARQQGKPVASVVREALSAYVAGRRTPGRLPSFVGIGSSGRSDLATRHEELLWTRPRHHAAGSRDARRPKRRPRRVATRGR